MSLDGPHCSLMGVRPQRAIDLPEVDDYTEGAWCSRCHRRVHVIGTPGVPVGLLVDDALVLALQAADIDHVPVFGWRCTRHRVTVVLPAPYVIAPDPYRRVVAEFDENEVALAVPAPVLERIDE